MLEDQTGIEELLLTQNSIDENLMSFKSKECDNWSLIGK